MTTVWHCRKGFLSLTNLYTTFHPNTDTFEKVPTSENGENHYMELFSDVVTLIEQVRLA